mmetsp:Transcript_31551/g.50655  ORF Transcript_31551/g.50655 Transcript_31551/m.50655 type:complete len:83 (+) Transcript_31551:574-822(+)
MFSTWSLWHENPDQVRRASSSTLWALSSIEGSNLTQEPEQERSIPKRNPLDDALRAKGKAVRLREGVEGVTLSGITLKSMQD